PSFKYAMHLCNDQHRSSRPCSLHLYLFTLLFHTSGCFYKFRYFIFVRILFKSIKVRHPHADRISEEIIFEMCLSCAKGTQRYIPREAKELNTLIPRYSSPM